MSKRRATRQDAGKAVSTAAILQLANALKSERYHVIEAMLDANCPAVVSLPSPSRATDARSFAVDYLLSEGLSKIEFLDFGIDKDKVAMGKFMEAEAACEQTNKRLAVRSQTTGISPESVISTAADKISSLLGEFSWDEAAGHFGFGTGASTRLTRALGDAPYKYSGTPETTPNCEALAVAAMGLVPSWQSQHSPEGGSVQQAATVAVVWGNRLDTVPKNAKTNRMIAVEPCMNMYVQKGIGALLRRKLKRVGVNLDCQGKNQHLAYVGSKEGELATIDLQMASDSVSQMLVARLLPGSWCDAIELTRSTHCVLLDGTIYQYQKVSSMGNGFTFELESLIFWALLQACHDLFGDDDHRFAVYGDDIICPVSYAASLIWVLEYCGFTCNTKKTHLDGPFRESCGKHYWNGVDVTPFYFKEALTSDHEVYRVFNRYREWKTRLFGWEEDSFSQYLRSLVAAPALVPYGVGDCGFVSEFDEVHPSMIQRRGLYFEGWVVRALLPRKLQHRSPYPDDGLFTSALLRSGYSQDVYGLLREARRTGKRHAVVPTAENKQHVGGYTYRRIRVLQWTSPGLSA